MAKYALICPASGGYMPGVNALLNALEYYKFDLDIYILLWDNFLSSEYKNSFPNVKFETIIPQNKTTAGWNCRFADIKKAFEIFDNYDAICLHGADVCIVNNWMKYFDISSKLDKVILSTNEHGTHYIDDLILKQPYKHTWSVPYADIPFIVPNGKKQILNLIMDYHSRNDCELAKMDALNYAIKEYDKDCVFELAGEQWVQNVPYERELVEGRNKSIYFKGSSTRLNTFHRKYWIKNICEKYLPGSNDISHKNKKIFNSFYRFFNTECRVKWIEGIEIYE